MTNTFKAIFENSANNDRFEIQFDEYSSYSYSILGEFTTIRFMRQIPYGKIAEGESVEVLKEVFLPYRNTIVDKFSIVENGATINYSLTSPTLLNYSTLHNVSQQHDEEDKLFIEELNIVESNVIM